MAAFDALFRDLGPSILSMFVSKPTRLRKTKDRYVPEESREFRDIIQDVTILTTPPLPYAADQLNGSSITAEDFRVYIPAKNLEEVGVSLDLTTDYHYYLTFRSKEYKVLGVTEHYSGDLIGLYELQLRA